MDINKHQPYMRLKGKMKELNVTVADIAFLLGISSTAVSHKINGKSDFYINEIERIEKRYGIGTEFFLN